MIFRTELGNWLVRRNDEAGQWEGTREDRPNQVLTHPALLGVMDQIYAIQQQEKQQDGSDSPLHAPPAN